MISYDVCVIGGSCTGVFAAINAARKGLSVCIIESSNCFGGTATAGMVNIWHTCLDSDYKTRIIGGLSKEVIDKLYATGDVITTEDSPHRGYTFDSEQLKFVLDKMVLEENIKPYLHTMFYEADVADGKVMAITIGNKDGLQKISAKFFIDATGDGDLCRAVGAEYYVDDALQPPSMCAKYYGVGMDRLRQVTEIIRDHGDEVGLDKDWGWRGFTPGSDRFTFHSDNHVFNVNCAKADDLTKSEIEGRRKVSAVETLLRKYLDKDVRVVTIPSYIGVRETYHIKSLHTATGEDLLWGKRFDDAIMNGSYRVDYHHGSGSGITFKYLDGTQETIPEAGAKTIHSRWRDEMDNAPTFYQLPYRALVPDVEIDNILMAGRMIDADREAFGALRVMINCNQMGEAAGMAAAIAIKDNIAAKDVPADKLRKALADNGSIII